MPLGAVNGLVSPTARLKSSAMVTSSDVSPGVPLSSTTMQLTSGTLPVLVTR